MQTFRGKKRPTNSIINLKLFTDSFSNPNPTKSQRRFQNGVVGLGIVAAMTDDNSTTHTHQQPICFAPSPRSTAPIPIKPNFDELSKKVDSVISLFGDSGCDDDNKIRSVLNMVRFKEFWNDGFLTNCHLCKKELHGLDIFMYRGEKAFCSAECRDKQITSDDDHNKQTCGAEAKKGKPLDCSEPALSCSGPQVLFAVVSAA